MPEKEKNLEYQNEELKKHDIMKGKKVKNIMKEDLYDLNPDTKWAQNLHHFYFYSDFDFYHYYFFLLLRPSPHF